MLTASRSSGLRIRLPLPSCRSATRTPGIYQQPRSPIRLLTLDHLLGHPNLIMKIDHSSIQQLARQQSTRSWKQLGPSLATYRLKPPGPRLHHYPHLVEASMMRFHQKASLMGERKMMPMMMVTCIIGVTGKKSPRRVRLVGVDRPGLDRRREVHI